MRRVLALVFLLAACQPIPHPFADSVVPSALPALSPPDSNGIVVLPVEGVAAPAAGELGDALAAALRDQDVPASTEASNRHSYRLHTTATSTPLDPVRQTVTLNWQLDGADGKELGAGAVSHVGLEAPGPAGDPVLAAALAADAAPTITRLVVGDTPAAGGGAEAMVALRAVAGAPGDGNDLLARAMVMALGRAGVDVAAGAVPARLFLTGRVEVAPPSGGKQQVKLHWILSKPNGGELGRADQENAVPAGSLDGAWSDIAYAAAAAAAADIAGLVRQAGDQPAGPPDAAPAPPR